MKIAKHNSIITFVAVCLALLFFGPAYSTAADTTTNLSKKELKVLLKNAKTPADQRTIATHYRERAEALSKTSKEHFESAELRAKNPAFPALEAKHGYAFGLGASHCRFWGGSDAEQSKKAAALAVLHEEMATKAELQLTNRVEVVNTSELK